MNVDTHLHYNSIYVVLLKFFIILRTHKYILMIVYCPFHYWQWFDKDAPESFPFPGRYSEGLSDLQQLLLLRCFRVDRVYRAITNFVMGRMGEQYVTPPVISFDNVYDQSTPQSPIVFILSPGADPAGDLGKLADRMGYGGNRFKFLAMGQGQEKVYANSKLIPPS